MFQCGKQQKAAENFSSRSCPSRQLKNPWDDNVKWIISISFAMNYSGNCNEAILKFAKFPSFETFKRCFHTFRMLFFCSYRLQFQLTNFIKRLPKHTDLFCCSVKWIASHRVYRRALFYKMAKVVRAPSVVFHFWAGL